MCEILSARLLGVVVSWSVITVGSSGTRDVYRNYQENLQMAEKAKESETNVNK